jgi:PKD repeat protein
MTVTSIGTATPGEFTLAAPKPDMVYRFTPYQPGEKLRPEAKLTASASEGTPPLTVRFTSSGDGRTRWDFGDGTTSVERNPTHVFKHPASMPSR